MTNVRRFCRIALVMVACSPHFIQAREPGEPSTLPASSARIIDVIEPVAILSVEAKTGRLAGCGFRHTWLIDDQNGRIIESRQRPQLVGAMPTSMVSYDGCINTIAKGPVSRSIAIRANLSCAIRTFDHGIGWSANGEWHVTRLDFDVSEIGHWSNPNLRWEAIIENGKARYCAVADDGESALVLCGYYAIGDVVEDDTPPKVWHSRKGSQPQVILSAEDDVPFERGLNCKLFARRVAIDQRGEWGFASGHVDGRGSGHVDGFVHGISLLNRKRTWTRYYAAHHVIGMLPSPTGKYLGISFWHEPDQYDQRPVRTLCWEIVDTQTGNSLFRCEENLGIPSNIAMNVAENRVHVGSDGKKVYSWDLPLRNKVE